MTKLDAGLITPLPASDPGSTAAWGSKRINPRPQSCLEWMPLQTTTTICYSDACLLFIQPVFSFQTNHSNPYPPGVVMFAPNSEGRLNLNVEFQPHEGSNPSRRIVVGGRKKNSSLNFAIVPPPSNSSASNMTSRSDWTAYQDGRLVERPSIPGASSNSSVKRHQTVICIFVILSFLIWKHARKLAYSIFKLYFFRLLSLRNLNRVIVCHNMLNSV